MKVKENENNNKNNKELNNKENNDDFYLLNPEDFPRYSYSFTNILYNNRMNYNEHNPFKRKYIGQFVLSEKLGQGTFGIVVLATHQITGEKVAVKILEKERILQEADKTRIEREIKILKNMRHNNIVHLYDIKETPSSLYIIMEYVPGKELFDYIINKKKLSELESCNFYQQIISGIEYLGKIRVVHRDLKPENLLLDEQKNIKIVDFGLSNIYPNNELLKTACGSPCYAAPEMINGEPYMGLRVDIWSSGIVLFAMLCGFLPFEDADNEKLYKKITEGKFKTPKYLSECCKDFLHRILNVNPEKRYTIDQIKNHPWFNIINPKINMSEGLLLNVYIVPIDESIIEEMVKKLKFNEEEVRANLITNNHNHTTTTYYLLLKKKLREGQKSIGDMKSKEFLNYLKNPANLFSTYGYNLKLIIQLRIKKIQDNENNGLRLRTQSGSDMNRRTNRLNKKQNSDDQITFDKKSSNNNEIKIKTIFNKKKADMKKRINYTRKTTNNNLFHSKEKTDNKNNIKNNYFKKNKKFEIKKKNNNESTKENLNYNINNSNSNILMTKNKEDGKKTSRTEDKKIKEYEINFIKKKKQLKENHEHSLSYVSPKQEENEAIKNKLNDNITEKSRDYSYDINEKNINKRQKNKKVLNHDKPKRTITNAIVPKTNLEKKYNFRTIIDKGIKDSNYDKKKNNVLEKHYTGKGATQTNTFKNLRENTDLNIDKIKNKNNCLKISTHKTNKEKDKKGFVKISELMGRMRMRVIKSEKYNSKEPKETSHEYFSKDKIYYLLTDKEKINKGNNENNLNIKEYKIKNRERQSEKNIYNFNSNNSSKLVKNIMEINSSKTNEKNIKIKKASKKDKSEKKERKTRIQKEVNERAFNKKGFIDTSVSFDKSHDGVKGRISTRPRKTINVQSEKKKINLNVKNKKKAKNILITDEAHHIEDDSSSSYSEKDIKNKNDEIKRKEKEIKYLKLKSKNKKFIVVKRDEEKNVNNNINNEKELFKLKSNNNYKQNEKNITKRNRLENANYTFKNFTNNIRSSNGNKNTIGNNYYNTIINNDLSNKTEKEKNGKFRKKIKTLNTQGNLIKKLTIKKDHLHNSLNDSKKNMLIKRTINSSLNDKIKSFISNNKYKSIEDIFYKTCNDHSNRQAFPFSTNMKRRTDRDRVDEIENINNEYKEIKTQGEIIPYDLSFIFMNKLNVLKENILKELKEMNEKKKWIYKIKKNLYTIKKNENQVDFEINKINDDNNNLFIIKVMKKQGNYQMCRDIIKNIIYKLK